VRGAVLASCIGFVSAGTGRRRHLVPQHMFRCATNWIYKSHFLRNAQGAFNIVRQGLCFMPVTRAISHTVGSALSLSPPFSPLLWSKEPKGFIEGFPRDLPTPPVLPEQSSSGESDSSSADHDIPCV
jgi:hypothetical protein